MEKNILFIIFYLNLPLTSLICLEDRIVLLRKVFSFVFSFSQFFVCFVQCFSFLLSDFSLSLSFTVSGHELKGLMTYFSLSIDGLNFPLMSLVDYRGFRLIAISVLPVTKNTLIYGSNDAGSFSLSLLLSLFPSHPLSPPLSSLFPPSLPPPGVTVVNQDPIFYEKMTKAAQLLNLKSHTCGMYDTTELASAADVEGHRGSDGKYYLLDFSRTLPPVRPDPSRFVCFIILILYYKNIFCSLSLSFLSFFLFFVGWFWKRRVEGLGKREGKEKRREKISNNFFFFS